MLITARLSLEATNDLVARMYAHSDQVRRQRVGGMELVSGVIGEGEGLGVALVIDGVTGESVRLQGKAAAASVKRPRIPGGVV